LNIYLRYDPRYRSWYVGATTGSKNIVIILDQSGSMEGDFISMARNAAISVVETLGNTDWVGLVNFDD
jgi:uncharacterized protein with von Willebrand factor type A (vWA) domain